jgi:integrase
MRVIQGHAAERRTTPLEEAYAHFRLDRQGLPVSAATLRLYEHTIGRFPALGALGAPGRSAVRGPRRGGRPPVSRRPGRPAEAARQADPAGDAERLGPRAADVLPLGVGRGLPGAERIRTLPKVRVPWKEPTLFHIRQVREILAACNPRLPQEAVAVRLLVGAGVRRLELCGLAVMGPDGLPDLNVDWLDRGVVELRVRGEAGAPGAGGCEAGERRGTGTEPPRFPHSGNFGKSRKVS